MDERKNPGNYRNNENKAKEQAYQEYLRLREDRNTRGNYIKDDTLYGSYFKNSSGNSIDNTPYGASEMRKQSRQRAEHEQYLRERDESRSEKKKPVARQGSVNKADKPTRAEKKAAKKAEKEGPAVSGGNGGGGRKRRRKKGRGLKVALVIVLLMVLGIGSAIAFGFTAVKNTLDNVGRVDLDPALIGINPQVDSDLRNYRNIALLGIDARDMSDDKNVRSDAIIVASINKETNEIKLFSVYRDTMLDIGRADNTGIALDKVTHGYFYGGPTKMLYALNKNLDLNIKEVVVVNWKSVADTVDALGGVDIEIKDSEIKEMNKYIQDTYNNIGGSNEKIKSEGMQTLNGNQAVTYARIRKDAVEGDYRRNERMKIVIKATFEKAIRLDPKAIKKISEDILPEIKTNMSSADMMNMMLKLTSYKMTDSVGWPYKVGSYSENGWFGPPVTLESNVIELHEQFFGQAGYIPTQDVINRSKKISARTGLY